MKRKYKNLPYDALQFKIYIRWKSMRRRCTNTNRNWYKKGIKICKEWENFENFYFWAIENGFDINKSQQEQSLDRIDNNGNYEPSNCRWTTIKNQNKNTSRTHYLTYKNEKHCISEWAEILNMNVKTLRTRLDKGWDINRCFNQPVKKSIKTPK